MDLPQLLEPFLTRRASSFLLVSLLAFAGTPVRANSCHYQQALLVDSGSVELRRIIKDQSRGERLELFQSLRALALKEIHLDRGLTRRAQRSLALLRAVSARTVQRVAQVKEGKTSEVGIVGGGIHATIVASTLTWGEGIKRSLSSLIFEAGKVVSAVFGPAGDGFRINTPEGDVSWNTMPNAVVQTADLVKGTERQFILAGMLGEVATDALAHTDAEVAFEQRVKRVQTRADGLVEMETEAGLVTRHDDVVIATGFGQPNVPVTEPESVAFVRAHYARQEASPDKLEQVVAVDHFYKYAAAGGKLPPPPKGRKRRVIVVGGGDGGRIAIEVVQKLARGEEIEVVWLSPELKSRAAFDAATQPRYRDIGDYVKFPEGETKPGANTTLMYAKTQMMGAANDGLVAVAAKSADGQVHALEGDLIVSCTGYESQVAALFAGQGEMQLVDVMGRTSQFQEDVPIAKQVVLDGKRQRVYLVGPAAGGLITVEVNGKKIQPPIIYRLGLATEETARRLANGELPGVDAPL
jgi:hypothetical protein